MNHRILRSPEIVIAAANAQLAAEANERLAPTLARQKLDRERRMGQIEQIERQKDAQIRRAVGAQAWGELETFKRGMRPKLPGKRPAPGEQPSQEFIAAVRSGRAQFDAKASALKVNLDIVSRINRQYGRRISALQRPERDTRLGGVFTRRAPPRDEPPRDNSASVFKAPFAAGKAWQEIASKEASMAEVVTAGVDTSKGWISAKSHIVLPGEEDYEMASIRWDGALLFQYKTPSDGFPQVLVTLTPLTLASLFYLGMDTWGMSSSSLTLSQQINAVWMDIAKPENTQTAHKTLLQLHYADDDDYAHDSKSLSTTQIVQLIGDKPVKAGTDYLFSLGLSMTSDAYSNDYMLMIKNEGLWRVDQIVALVD